MAQMGIYCEQFCAVLHRDADKLQGTAATLNDKLQRSALDQKC